MGLRSRAATAAVNVVNATSRLTGRGSGTVAGGRVGLRIDPGLLEHLAQGRRVALVSGTNGKTTTTALLAATLGGPEALATNATGSNMPAGHIAALVTRRRSSMAVLEVDEGYLDQVIGATNPEVVVLLNLSRDQLDRMSEVRMVAERWRRALAQAPATTVVANADDPLIVFAASAAPSVCWVSGGLRWREDATGCPSCGGHIRFDDHGGWRCDACELERPQPRWWLEGDVVKGPDVSQELRLALPGRFNVENATMAFAAASAMGVPAPSIASAMAEVVDVAGRFVIKTVGSTPVRLMLAKNPAGWSARLELVAEGTAPTVVSINSRTADGADPSWLFDVDFTKLAGRRVVATGDRFRDLSVRLHYAGVPYDHREDAREAVDLAGSDGVRVDVIGNYTAFRDLLEST